MASAQAPIAQGRRVGATHEQSPGQVQTRVFPAHVRRPGCLQSTSRLESDRPAWPACDAVQLDAARARPHAD